MKTKGQAGRRLRLKWPTEQIRKTALGVLGWRGQERSPVHCVNTRHYDWFNRQADWPQGEQQKVNGKVELRMMG